MALLDTVQDVFRKVLPPKEGRISASNSGIGNGGHSMFTDEDMIVSKPTIILHTTQAFFNFLAMACFASVAGFQSHWGIGVSGLSGFALFVTISGIFLSLFMLLVPVMYEKYDKFARLARALKETRVGFILGGSGAIFSLLISFIVTISAWTEPGCKNPENDPHKELGKDFQIALNGWCNTKKAAAIFMWIAFAAWAGTLAFTVRDWRQGSNNRARDPPFRPPNMAPGTDFPDETDTVHGRDRTDDSESVYEPLPPIRRQTSDDFASGGPARSPFSDDNRYSGASGGGYGGGGGGYGSGGGGYAAGRPSMDAYGAFSDPAPSGYGVSSPGAGSGAMPQPGVSRTMQYADPYAAVRASIAGGGQASGPPSYDNQGYR